VADKICRYKMFGITILKFPGRKRGVRHALGVSQITTGSMTSMRIGIPPATDNAGPRLPPTPAPAKPPASAGGFVYRAIETMLVTGERLVDYP
jgi:hypothetical protein